MIGVKPWACSTPTCGSVRPACCAACGRASREPGKPLTLVGHGLLARTIEGPLEPGGDAVDCQVQCRRFLCTACGAVLVVVPRGVGRGFRYALSCIAYALALWGYARTSAQRTRAATSAASARGLASPEQWSSLRRWVRRAPAIFGAGVPATTGSLRERAAQLAVWIAAHAPLPTTHVPHDAFFGGCFIEAR